MKTKIIPFDLAMAEKIQDGEIKGKIVRRDEHKQVCEILEFHAEYQDKSNEKFLIVKVPAHDVEKEQLWIYHQDGRAMHSSNYEEMWYDLVLEVPDEPQFKPFDKVLVYNRRNGKWFPDFFSHISSDGRIVTITDGFYKSYEVVNYEGNEHLAGTTDKPKELC